MNQAAERVESLKAGFVGAVATAIVFSVTTSVVAGWTAWMLLEKSTFALGIDSLLNFRLIVQAGIAGFSGFLFGVTYRYVVRSDRNSHLKQGAVLAFGLVRGLAQLDATLTIEADWLSGTKILESVLMFAIAALLLDQLMQRGWIKVFDPQ